jgi:long-chain acyl-CoA synthetase
MTGLPWLKSYPPGVAAEIDITAYRSIADIQRKCCQRFAALPAYTCMGRTLRYHEVERLSRDLAAYFHGTLGLARGARVALMMPNVLQYPIAIYAALRAGLVVVNVNPLYTPRELELQLIDSGAEAIVVLENFASTVQQVLPRVAVKHVLVTGVGDLLGIARGTLTNLAVRHVKKEVCAWQIGGAVRFSAALALGAAQSYSDPEVGRDDLAFLQYTGGTTGVPKAAMLTHGNIVANLLQASAWVHDAVHEGDEVVITALPLHHIFALTANCLAFFKFGGENILIPNPRDLDGFVATLAKTRFTAITGVNTLFAALLAHPGFSKLDFSGLRLALGGGMAVQRAVAERWKAVTGVPILEAYGLTETSPGACCNPPGKRDWSGSIGLPYPSTRLSIRDDAGQPLPPGSVGEICIAGPQVMAGYWQRPEETAKVMTADGALRTGDLGIMSEDGYFRVVDRKKDMILVSGFNVYPNEIEDVVAMHPGVAECCAVALPDAKSGEAVRLVVVARDPALSKADLLRHCRAGLTGYKVPKSIEFWRELPKSHVGKILRRQVRDTAPQPAD